MRRPPSHRTAAATRAALTAARRPLSLFCAVAEKLQAADAAYPEAVRLTLEPPPPVPEPEAIAPLEEPFDETLHIWAWTLVERGVGPEEIARILRVSEVAVHKVLDTSGRGPCLAVDCPPLNRIVSATL